MGDLSSFKFLQMAHDCISKKDLLSKLELKKPLKIKAGFDPTYPDLHLGHCVLLNQLKVFQDLGHQVIFLIGDFTAQIGDPSGRDETRPSLSIKEIEENTLTYMNQVFKILDKKKTKIMKNSTWMNAFKPQNWIQLSSFATVAQILERDDFSKRYRSQKPIYLHEILYPLIQGYDSVAIQADVEVGGSDQLFNLLMGRELQSQYGQVPQCVLTFPLLEGLDGHRKMSKSYDNFIALNDSPQKMFGKIMSVSDELMLKYYRYLILNEDIEQLQKNLNQEKTHPLKEKKRLARLLVSQFHSEKDALESEKEFERVFSQKQMPQKISQFVLKQTDKMFKGLIHEDKIWLCYLLKESGLCSSTAEAKRVIEQGGVRVDSKKITDVQCKIKIKKGDDFVIQVGKRNFLNIQCR